MIVIVVIQRVVVCPSELFLLNPAIFGDGCLQWRVLEVIPGMNGTFSFSWIVGLR